MIDLKPIQTRYKGHKFRSRLEARWAVFLDNLGIEWRYEDEGYDLDGLWYLPDFWLPTFDDGCYLEVKPDELNSIELEKAHKLCLISGKKVILAVGIPDYKCQQYIYREECDGVLNTDICHGLMNADKASSENRFYVFPGYEEKDLTISPYYYDCVGERYGNAVIEAKGAQFNGK